LKSVIAVGKTSYSTVKKNAGGNDTVPILVWRGGGMRSNECSCSSWLFVEFLVQKCSTFKTRRSATAEV